MSILDWIHGFDRFDGRIGIKPGLERMEAMLSRLGNPEQQLKFLHVAGTNGKGSTCAYLASILEEAGYRVGLYTSPYLTEFNDRMSVGGQNIPQAQLEGLVARLRPVVDEVSLTECGRPTEFEVVTTLSLLFYAEEKVEFVVWETGLGGRLDSTNVVTPVLSLITNVGYDHQAILGETLEQIAAEKAGIVKRGVPVLTTATGVARDVIAKTAMETESPFMEGTRDFRAERTAYGLDGQRFIWSDGEVVWEDLFISMLGAHQVTNASLAVAACVELRRQGYELSLQAIRNGLAKTKWAGRLEIISHHPLLMLDGAHNPEGAAALAAALRELVPDRRVILVTGILADKAIPDVLAPVLELADHVIVTAPDIPRAADVEDVAAVIRELAPLLTVQTIPSVRVALQTALERVESEQDAIICTGSLYTISEARAVLMSE